MTVTLPGAKWALAVMTSMIARPWAAAAGQLSNRRTPSAPNPRKGFANLRLSGALQLPAGTDPVEAARPVLRRLLEH